MTWNAEVEAEFIAELQAGSPKPRHESAFLQACGEELSRRLTKKNCGLEREDAADFSQEFLFDLSQRVADGRLLGAFDPNRGVPLTKYVCYFAVPRAQRWAGSNAVKMAPFQEWDGAELDRSTVDGDPADSIFQVLRVRPWARSVSQPLRALGMNWWRYLDWEPDPHPALRIDIANELDKTEKAEGLERRLDVRLDAARDRCAEAKDALTAARVRVFSETAVIGSEEPVDWEKRRELERAVERKQQAQMKRASEQLFPLQREDLQALLAVSESNAYKISSRLQKDLPELVEVNGPVEGDEVAGFEALMRRPEVQLGQLDGAGDNHVDE